MKDIRIFVASSKELLLERNYLAYLALAYEGEFERLGFRVRLSKWEYVDPTMTEARTEDRYLDEMLDCDAVLMMFRHVLGMYTKEEVDKAIAAEVAGTSRIKKHLMLFKDGDVEPSAELAEWRATLAEGTYGTFTDFDELKVHFLRLVEELSGLPLQDIAQDESTRTVSAFLAVDDELAADRNAFADAVLNLNDVLIRRGARVRLRFYDPDKHRELLESSEMALVLYHTKCGDFGEKALDESYDRSKRDENPKRLYVFFRDADGQPLDGGFEAFKNGFAGKFGSAPCRFENVDTLSLNFLFSLESVLGDDSGTFVKLDGRTVVADGLEVGDLAKLPMLEKNDGLAALFSRMQDVSKRFVEQRGKCEKDPQNDGLYVELLDISAEKNRLQDQIDRELKMAFNLAKRMAAVSIAQTNETIARARAKMDEGKIKEALEILDGASAAMKRRRLLHRAAERAEAEELQIKELKAGIEIEYFRIDAVMAYTAMPFDERFKKVEGIYKSLVEDVGTFAEMCTMRNKDEMDLLHADTLRAFARSYDMISDSLSPIPLLSRALCIYQMSCKPGYRSQHAKCEHELATCYLSNNDMANALEHLRIEKSLLEDCSLGTEIKLQVARCVFGMAKVYQQHEEYTTAVSNYREAERIFTMVSGEDVSSRYDLAMTLSSLGGCYKDIRQYVEAEHVLTEAVLLRRELSAKSPEKYGGLEAGALRVLAITHEQMENYDCAQKEYEEALAIYRKLAELNSAKYLVGVANVLDDLGVFWNVQGSYVKAIDVSRESLTIYRRLAAFNHGRYDHAVAFTARELADSLAKQGKKDDSLKLLDESLAIFRNLAEADYSMYGGDVMETLYRIATWYSEDGESTMAVKYYNEARESARQLSVRTPEKYDIALLRICNGLIEVYKKIGDTESVKKYEIQRFQIIKRWAERGEPLALNSLGWTYFKGIGTSKDYIQAFKWTFRAAQLGNKTGSAETLWRMYRDGLGVDRDTAEALRWLKIAVEANNAAAQAAYGECLEYGRYGLSVDITQAAELYKSSSARRNPAGLYNYGRCCLHGIGVEKDVPRAVDLLRKAANSYDDDLSYDILAMRLLETIDTQKAEEWAIKAERLEGARRTK